MPLLYLALVSIPAWLMSILAGGGSPFVLIPVVNLLLGPSSVPPVITVGMSLGNAHRILLFWREINWVLTLWYVPGAILGAVLGAYTYTQTDLDWLQLLIGVFLILSMISLGTEQKEPSFHLKPWYILPAGFFKAFISGLVGTTGPILNPFYLGYGLVKEKLIATKATHVVVIHLVKIVTYASLGALSWHDLGAGLVIGAVAVPANLLGKRMLQHMDAVLFRRLVLAMMAMSGLWMLWGQRSLVLSL